MKKSIKKLPKSKIEIEVEIPTEDWEDFLNEAVKDISLNLKVAGFRPGSVPRNIVEKEIGMEKILARASELAVRKTYVKMILDDKIEAVGSPNISVLKVAPGNPFVFKAEVAVLPEVKLPDYTKIIKGIKPAEEAKVEGKEIDEAVSWLQKSRAKFTTVKREARKDDRVEIDFETELEGKKVENGKSENHPLIIGQSKFVRGFDEQLIGMKEEEEKEFTLVFPEDYHQKNLADQPVDFKVKMKLVQEQELPEINDYFAQGLGDFKDLEALRESIKHGVLYEKKEKVKQDWRQKAVNETAEKSEIDLPDILIDKELEGMVGELKNSAGQIGLEWKKYLEGLKKTEDDLKKDFAKQAERRVRSALVLREIAKKENIEVTDKETEGEINRVLQKYPDIEGAKGKVDIDALKEYTYGVLRNEKVFKRLEEC